MLVVSSLVLATPAKAEIPPSKVYFVAIGSENYIAPDDPKAPRWPPVSAPVNSATRVSALLRRIGARYGILLTSSAEHLVSKSDMERAIVDLKSQIRRDMPDRPVILFYYMGHALGDRYSQFLYLAPGDLTPAFSPSQSTMWLLQKRTLSNTDVIASLEIFRLPPVMAYLDAFFPSDLAVDLRNPQDILRVTRETDELLRQDDYNRRHGLYPPGNIPPIPYLALFDDCYDQVAQNLTNGHATGLFENLIEETRKILSDRLSGAQPDGLALYAARPGTPIGDFADPDDDLDPLPIGSLARRLILALRLREHARQITLAELRKAMFDPAGAAYGADRARFSVNSPTPYSLAPSPRHSWEQVTLPIAHVPPARRGALDVRSGTSPPKGATAGGPP